MTLDALAALIDEVARTLAPDAVARLAAGLERLDGPTPDGRWQAIAAVPTSIADEHTARLFDAWREQAPALTGAAVALGLRAAARTAESLKADRSLDVVWTGPTSRHVPVRLTRAALLEVIGAARRELALVSYAAFRIQAVLDALAAVAARGVEIRLILESVEDSAGILTVDAARAFASVRDQVAFYVWPAQQRPRLARGTPLLHAKAAIADDTTALISSANLTEQAITGNIELGLLVRGGPVPRRLRDHFRELIARHVLAPVSRTA